MRESVVVDEMAREMVMALPEQRHNLYVFKIDFFREEVLNTNKNT